MTLPIAPLQTLFVRNLTDKLSNNELKRELYYLFSSISPVVEIQCRKGKSRGMAWISFPTLEGATSAMAKLNGFNFIGKELYIEFSKNRSKTIAEIFDSNFLKNNEENEIIKEEKIEISTLEIIKYPPKIAIQFFQILCNKFPGFQKVEKVDDHLLIRFENHIQAQDAMKSLNEFSVGGGEKLIVNLFNEI